MKLKSKLVSAFRLCAVITVAVAVLGQLGSQRIYVMLDRTVSNNLILIQKTDSIKANAIATNRDMFKAISLVLRKATPDELNAAVTSFRDNQADAEKDFKIYRATPLLLSKDGCGAAPIQQWLSRNI